MTWCLATPPLSVVRDAMKAWSVDPSDTAWSRMSGDLLASQRSAADCAKTRQRQVADQHKAPFICHKWMIALISLMLQPRALARAPPRRRFSVRCLLQWTSLQFAITFSVTTEKKNHSFYSSFTPDYYHRICVGAGVAGPAHTDVQAVIAQWWRVVYTAVF